MSNNEIAPLTIKMEKTKLININNLPNYLIEKFACHFATFFAKYNTNANIKIMNDIIINNNIQTLYTAIKVDNSDLFPLNIEQSKIYITNICKKFHNKLLKKFMNISLGNNITVDSYEQIVREITKVVKSKLLMEDIYDNYFRCATCIGKSCIIDGVSSKLGFVFFGDISYECIPGRQILNTFGKKVLTCKVKVGFHLMAIDQKCIPFELLYDDDYRSNIRIVISLKDIPEI